MDITMISPDTLVFGPDILSLIEIELQTRKMTYGQIASKIHSAAGTVGSWFSRGAIPTDKLWGVISAIGSGRLWMQVISKIPGNAFKLSYLDNTDDHPLVALDELDEITERLQTVVREAKTIMRHKKAGYQFSPEEEVAIIQIEDSVAECINMGQMFLLRMEERFGRPVRATMERNNQRMIERGYQARKEKSRNHAAPAI